jgi:hypothetical protein
MKKQYLVVDNNVWDWQISVQKMLDDDWRVVPGTIAMSAGDDTRLSYAVVVEKEE